MRMNDRIADSHKPLHTSNHSSSRSTMKKLLLAMMPVALLLILAAATIPQARHTASAASQLKLVPLIVRAPDDTQTPTAGPFASVCADWHPASTVLPSY